ncbi:MAG TPA: YncE family protein [Steroidobacteraceae bacterium]|jgi:YVTN family beta-propeller protein
MQATRFQFHRWLQCGVCLVLAGLSIPEAAIAKNAEVLQRWTLGGVGGWDYLTFEAGTDRLFISRGTHVDVISTDSGKLVGSIPDTLGVHGIALAASLKRGYTSNGRANTVTVFDLDTLKVIQEVKVSGSNPDAILYEPAGKHVFTFNGTSKDVTVLDAATLNVLATIAVPGKPEFAADDGQGQIFVNIETDPGQLTVIDARKLTVKATWPLPGCDSPSGLAIDNVHHRLFSVCDGKVMAVTDSLTGKQVARVPIGEHPDAAAYDSKRGLVYSSNGEGNLTVVHQDTADRYSVVATVPTQLGARTMALDAASGKVYLVTADFGPPPPATEAQPRPRPTIKPDSFVVLVVGAML